MAVLTRDMTLSDVQRVALDADARDAAFVMDEDAFRVFYDRTARPVWAYLSRLTGSRQLADDLLQEAYYRFLRAGSTYENDAHRRNSLFQIATNLARDAHRRRRTQPSVVEHDVAATPAAGDVAARVERTTDLSRAMRDLKPRERALLWLAYAEGSSHREIARALGLKHGSIKPLLFRARRRLAAILRTRGATCEQPGARS
jgi:RNA polymerase sigma-70 factor (ECF subfamily)